MRVACTFFSQGDTYKFVHYFCNPNEKYNFNIHYSCWMCKFCNLCLRNKHFLHSEKYIYHYFQYVYVSVIFSISLCKEEYNINVPPAFKSFVHRLRIVVGEHGSSGFRSSLRKSAFILLKVEHSFSYG